MKKKLLYLTILCLLLFVLLQIFGNTNATIHIAQEALALWREKLFPSLFPFLVLGETLILLGVPSYLSYLLDTPFAFLFHLRGQASFVLLMSMISGFPSGPKYTVRLFQKQDITLEEANRLLMVCHFSNPLFILGTVLLVLGQPKVTFCLFGAHFAANFLLLFLTRGTASKTKQKKTAFKTIFDTQVAQFSTNYLTVLDILQSTMQTMLFMLGSITFFMLLAHFLQAFATTSFLKILVTGLLDMTSGIALLETESISLFLKGFLATLFLSFGGCSVHLQVLNVLKDQPLSYRAFLKGRILASCLALVLFLLFYAV